MSGYGSLIVFALWSAFCYLLGALGVFHGRQR